jgi:hypothetical protein
MNDCSSQNEQDKHRYEGSPAAQDIEKARIDSTNTKAKAWKRLARTNGGNLGRSETPGEKAKLKTEGTNKAAVLIKPNEGTTLGKRGGHQKTQEGSDVEAISIKKKKEGRCGSSDILKEGHPGEEEDKEATSLEELTGATDRACQEP